MRPTITIPANRRRAPIPAPALRIIQERECMAFGYSLGGEFRTNRQPKFWRS